MKILTLIIRLLVGLIFVVFGVNIFFGFMPMPELPHNAMGDFLNSIFRSGYIYAIGACEVAGGLLLLIGRFIPLGLTLLGPVVVNILLFHVFMDPSKLLIAIVVLALWLFLMWRWRGAFAGIFQSAVR